LRAELTELLVGKLGNLKVRGELIRASLLLLGLSLGLLATSNLYSRTRRSMTETEGSWQPEYEYEQHRWSCDEGYQSRLVFGPNLPQHASGYRERAQFPQQAAKRPPSH
jgi:hypothetical protein